MKTLDDLKREVFDGLMPTQHWHGSERGNAEHYIGLAIDHLHSQGLLMVWQPIGTCPPDEYVLLYCPDRGLANEERVELRVFRSTKGGFEHAWATHWMPLPKPPKE